MATFASYVMNAVLFGLSYLAYLRSHEGLILLPLLLVYVAWSWYLPFFVAMLFTIPECPRPFFTAGKFMGSSWRSSRQSAIKGRYQESGPFHYFGFAYLWARHWSLMLDWFTADEDFAVYYLVHEVK
jgi:hypothetical protein